MRAFILIIGVLLVSSPVLSQAVPGQNHDAEAKEGIRKLHADYNESATKRARAALER